MTAERKVNLFLLGFQKCGTTSMAHYLSRSTDVFVPKIKEVQFFSNDGYFEKGDAYYHKFFSELTGASSYFCDASPHYIASKAALARLSEYNRKSKFILLMRDPEERMYSQIRMMKSRGKEPDDLNTIVARDLKALSSTGLYAEISMDENYVQNSLYGALFERALEFLPAENFLLLHQKSFREPEKLAAAISAFLDIEFSPQFLEGQYNTGSDASISVFAELMKRFPVLARIGRILPEHQRRTISRGLRFATELRIKRKWETAPLAQCLDPKLLKDLQRVFAADRAKLHRIISIQPVQVHDVDQLG